MASRHGRLLSPIVHAHTPSILPRGDGMTLGESGRRASGGWQTMLLQSWEANPSLCLQESISVLLDDDAMVV